MSYKENPRQLPHGFNKLTSKDSDMLMDIGVQVMNPGDKEVYCSDTMETAFVILTGEVKIHWADREETMQRSSLFDESPYCLHVPRNTAVTIEAVTPSEVLIQQTDNDTDFAPVFYRPEDVQSDIFGLGMWNDTGERTVRTIFDLSNAPYSNMVNGEVINSPGRWSSYIPHHHPQPEVYYYKFDKPQGFGASFVGDNVYKSTHNGVAEISNGIHSQVAAPGYAMWYSWMIRHLPGDPWDKTRIDLDEHKWLLDPNAKIWSPKKD